MLYRYVEQLLNVYNYIDAMLVTDERGVIRFYKCFRPDVNPTTPKDVLGRHILEVYPELDENTSTVMRVLRTGEPILNEYQEFFFKGLGINSVNTTLPVRDRDRLVGVLCAARYLDPPFQRRGVTLDLKEPSREEALYTVDDIVSLSPAMDLVKERIHMIADTGSSVLLYGETGTGKELVAQSIHSGSARRGKRFVSQNCAAIPGTLLESILFGTVKGSYTGAENRPGLFELADGGTLFLDEINSMPLNLQGKVLRALETKTIQRLGSTRSKKVDFRLLTASNEDLYHLVEEKKFRADLYYRLAVIPIRLPPLRERREDIIPLAQHFLKLFCRKYAKDKEFSPQTLQLMIQYPWPGNVRELRNFVERAVVMSLGRQVAVPDVSSFLDPAPASPLPERPGEDSASVYSPAVSARYEQMISSGVSLQQYLDQCGRNYVAYALQKYGNSYKAAEALGTSQASIMRRKQKFHL